MQIKKFRSIVHEVIILPLVVMMGIIIITIISCIISYKNMEEKMVENNLNSLQVALSQLDNLISQIDNDFVQYVTTDESYFYMHTYDKTTPKLKYFRYEAATINWLSNQANNYGDIEGVFAFYQNMDLLLFRGSSNRANMNVHNYIKEHLHSNDVIYNHLNVVKISDTYYLLYVKKYGDFCGGCWIPVQKLTENLGLNKSKLLGTVYLTDRNNNNTLINADLNLYLKEHGLIKKVKVSGKKYNNYNITSRDENFYFGMLLPNTSIIINLPIINKLIFIIALLSIILVPRMIYWLKIKIANPLRTLDNAMAIISKGDSDYRIPLQDKMKYDEFDKLMDRFNKMMDELNELEINLYKTKIKEQKTELKYISQQIRPHFILNALNIIYTYDIKEFDLAKKMVLYLTKYFRYIVNLQEDFVELEKEFRHVETYLQIQKERYLDRLGFFVEWENQVKSALIPPLIIQTFVENCIKYAITNDDKIFIFVLAQEENEQIKITVADTGKGFKNEILDKIQTFINTRVYQDDLGVGIQNAIERMDILYQKKIDINVRNALNGGAVIEIVLPLNVSS